MNTIENIISLLTDLSHVGGIQDHTSYPNADNCYDAIETLKRIQKYYNIPYNAYVPRTLMDCPVCHGNKVVSRIIDHEANGDSVWGEVRCYHCDGKGKVAGS